MTPNCQPLACLSMVFNLDQHSTPPSSPFPSSSLFLPDHCWRAISLDLAAIIWLQHLDIQPQLSGEYALRKLLQSTTPTPQALCPYPLAPFATTTEPPSLVSNFVVRRARTRDGSEMPERTDDRERRVPCLFAPALWDPGRALLHAVDFHYSPSPVMLESSRQDGTRVSRIY